MKANSEIKTIARDRLGNEIFGKKWMLVLTATLVATAILSAPACIPVAGSVAMILLIGPAMVGLYAYLLKMHREEDANFTQVFKGFTEDFGGNLLLGLMTYIYTFLWSLLFIIPGIVKGYSYSMAYFIKNDNPEYDWKTCIDESKKMMDGHKAQLFWLDMSFIGWYIVGYLCLMVGIYWVMPYHYMARTEFYEELKSGIVVDEII